MTSKTESVFQWIIIGVFAIAAIWWCSLTSYQLFFMPAQNASVVTLNVVGIENATNNSIVSLQYDCVKWCQEHFGSSAAMTYVKECWNECEKIGVKQ